MYLGKVPATQVKKTIDQVISLKEGSGKFQHQGYEISYAKL